MSQAIPLFLYGCEIWTLKQWVISRLKAAEMKFMRCITRYSLLDNKRNEVTLEEPKIGSRNILAQYD